MRKISTVLGLSAGALVLFGIVHYHDWGWGNQFPSLLTGSTSAIAQEAGTAKVVFVVHCYDEGNDAVKGLKGVRKVERGFRHFREINAVYYDPKEITIEDMEKALKRAGTYEETIRE